MASPALPAKVKGIDHLVLTCADVDTTTRWYTELLGFEVQTFKDNNGTTRTALLFGAQKFNLHQRGAEFEPKAHTALPGTVDICLEMEEGTDLEVLAAELRGKGLEFAEEGQVVKRTGARGPIRSIYIRDPDSNLVE